VDYPSKVLALARFDQVLATDVAHSTPVQSAQIAIIDPDFT
jgi:hypothetical protein